MTSLKTAEQLAGHGIDPDCSLESLIKEIEELGYDKLTLTRTSTGYKCTLMYKGNAFVYNTLLANSCREAVARALLWGLKDISQQYEILL